MKKDPVCKMPVAEENKVYNQPGICPMCNMKLVLVDDKSQHDHHHHCC